MIARVALAFIVMLVVGLPLQLGAYGDDGAATAEARSVEQWIEELGHASFAVRTEATRRLCEIGATATALLKQAASSTSAEVSLRVGKILGAFDRQLFAGVSVELALSATSAAWRDPVDLKITFRNHSAFPSRLPVDTDSAARDSLSADARQVGDMLDIADWLTVRDERGRYVELRVDDILSDTAIASAVDRRLKGEPMSSLAAGEEVTILVKSFNRGWARYPLLDEGRYTVQFDYMPEWEDEWLRDRNVGRVTSNSVNFTVAHAAPPTVNRGRIEASLAMHIEAGRVVATVTNNTDQEAVINRHLGPVVPFAQVQWIHTCDGVQHIVVARAEPSETWMDFDGDLLTPVAPGESIAVATITTKQLREALAEKGADLSCNGARLHVTYKSLGNRQWQVRHGTAELGNEHAPKGLQSLLPRRLLATRLASTPIDASLKD